MHVWREFLPDLTLPCRRSHFSDVRYVSLEALGVTKMATKLGLRENRSNLEKRPADLETTASKLTLQVTRQRCLLHEPQLGCVCPC